MTYAIGDEVEILVDHVPNCIGILIDPNTIGVVSGLADGHEKPPPVMEEEDQGKEFTVIVDVPCHTYDGKKRTVKHAWWFMDHHIKPWHGHYRMHTPDMELDEIERAQAIFQEVSDV